MNLFMDGDNIIVFNIYLVIGAFNKLHPKSVRVAFSNDTVKLSEERACRVLFDAAHLLVQKEQAIHKII
jgi:hypothetical protein